MVRGAGPTIAEAAWGESVATLFKKKSEGIPGDCNDCWSLLREEVSEIARSETMLASYLHATVLNHASLEDALSYLLAEKLATAYLSAMSLREVIDEAFAKSPEIRAAIRRDLHAIVERDPAARGFAQPFLHYKGFHALQAFRVSHWLWEEGRHALAYYFQNRVSMIFAIDIHPAARIGKGILIDHGTGVVIGETAVVGDDVSMLHGVTLGGTGKETGDRHPKIGDGVLLGTGAIILGNVRVGTGSKVAAGSVVLEEVPSHTTVAGVPAKAVGRPKAEEPSLDMDQGLELDYSI
jgi:serine O-acetyltransferase